MMKRMCLGQKIHQSEPRRMLNRLVPPDVQWAVKSIVNRIHERGHANKVSMKKKRKRQSKCMWRRQIFIPGIFELVASAAASLAWHLALGTWHLALGTWHPTLNHPSGHVTWNFLDWKNYMDNFFLHHSIQ